jgi:hypothetical protein
MHPNTHMRHHQLVDILVQARQGVLQVDESHSARITWRVPWPTHNTQPFDSLKTCLTQAAAVLKATCMAY